MIGCDIVHDIPSTHVEAVAPVAVQFLRNTPKQPFFPSVGFFETHRSYFEPSSVRDTLYSLPPAHLPDVPVTREDMAAFKASARSLDHGVGSVLNALVTGGIVDDTLVVCTTDHGLALPGSKATLTDRGTGVLLMIRGPHGFTGGKVVDALVSQIDVYPTLLELVGLEPPDFLQGVSLMPLIRGERAAVRDEVFTELTYHAAYEPQRAVRTERHKYIRRYLDGPPVLANIDDSATKDYLIEHGWADRPLPRDQLFDLLLDPNETRNLWDDPEYAGVRTDLESRLNAWMRATDDPLLRGDVAAPAGARLSTREQRSADEPTIVTG
jgi:N-sulfoglucosamine sulfohydrolase